jgi:hypothetical protein
MLFSVVLMGGWVSIMGDDDGDMEWNGSINTASQGVLSKDGWGF